MIFDFVIGLNFINLLTALLLVPILALLHILNEFVKVKAEDIEVSKFLDGLLGIIGIGLICYIGYKILTNLQTILNIDNLLVLMLPPILTVAFLPFIYIIALWIAYENMFWRLNYRLKENKAVARYAKYQILRYCRFSLNKLRIFSKQNTGDLWRIKSKNDVLIIIQKFISEG